MAKAENSCQFPGLFIHCHFRMRIGLCLSRNSAVQCTVQQFGVCLTHSFTTVVALIMWSHHYSSSINKSATVIMVWSRFPKFQSRKQWFLCSGSFLMVMLQMKGRTCLSMSLVFAQRYRQKNRGETFFFNFICPWHLINKCLVLSHYGGQSIILCDGPLGNNKWKDSSELYTEMHYARSRRNKTFMIYFIYTYTT